MKGFLLSILLALPLGLGTFVPAMAQSDEIVVTGSRIVEEGKDVFLEKQGDYLLLPVTLVNDSRDHPTRMRELDSTLDSILTAAKRDPSIELSLVNENDFVRPLTRNAFKAGITPGSRPDTSIAYLQVKTGIPAQVSDSYKLARKLAVFAESVKGTGRTEIIAGDEVQVSVQDPYQYRDELRKKVLADIKSTVDALGADYRVIVHGMDNPMQWARSGDLKLAFYMNFSYEIIPASLSSYEVPEDY